MVGRRGRRAKMRKRWRELLKSSLLCRIFKDCDRQREGGKERERDKEGGRDRENVFVWKQFF